MYVADGTSQRYKFSIIPTNILWDENNHVLIIHGIHYKIQHSFLIVTEVFENFIAGKALFKMKHCL